MVTLLYVLASPSVTIAITTVNRPDCFTHVGFVDRYTLPRPIALNVTALIVSMRRPFQVAMVSVLLNCTGIDRDRDK